QFKRERGVHHYTLERRLLRVHRALAAPRDGRPIMALAERYGFASHAHLSRQFRQRFGYSPSEVRGNRARVLRMRAKVEDAGGNSPRFDDWVRTLRAQGGRGEPTMGRLYGLVSRGAAVQRA